MSNNKLAVIEPEIVTVEMDRHCATCCEVLPISDFQDAIDGPIFESCRKCRLADRQADLVKAKEQSDQVQQVARHLAAAARGDHIESAHIAEVDAEMQRLWGGVTGFCKAWFDDIQLALTTRPGTKTTLDQFVHQVKLKKYATEHRSSAPDVVTLTDEELGKEMLKLVQSAIHPRLGAKKDD